jgi:hypothetical protein
MQRFVWDLSYPNPPGDYDLPISAIYRNTPFVPLGPYVLPGRYTVRLTVDGKAYSQPLNVRMDPRVVTPSAALQQQYEQSMRAYRGIVESAAMMQEVRKASDELASAHSKAGSNAALVKEIETLQDTIGNLAGTRRGRGQGGPTAPVSISEMPLSGLSGAYTSMLELLQEADASPTSQAVRDLSALDADLARITAAWAAVRSTSIPALETKLKAAGISL